MSVQVSNTLVPASLFLLYAVQFAESLNSRQVGTERVRMIVPHMRDSSILFLGRANVQIYSHKDQVMKIVKMKEKLYCGIDVSGDTLDICYQTIDGTLEWTKCTNNQEGFREIWKLTGKQHHFVIESTGVYQLPFCFFLETKKQSTVW